MLTDRQWGELVLFDLNDLHGWLYEFVYRVAWSGPVIPDGGCYTVLCGVAVEVDW